MLITGKKPQASTIVGRFREDAAHSIVGSV